MKNRDHIVSKNTSIEYFDLDQLPNSLFIRNYRKGDWFIPLGMSGKKKLQDFFVNEQVPNYKRNRIPLLVGNKTVIWIIGYRIDDRYKVTKNTKRIVKFEIIQ